MHLQILAKSMYLVQSVRRRSFPRQPALDGDGTCAAAYYMRAGFGVRDGFWNTGLCVLCRLFTDLCAT